MSKEFQSMMNEIVKIEISGKRFVRGRLIDTGNDLIVLFNGKDYLYIPVFHIQNFKVDLDLPKEHEIMYPTDYQDIYPYENKEDLSLRKVLTEAKGMFVEIYVTSGQPLSGFITSIMNNYFVFHSPIYKTMYITLKHLKWLIPYNPNQRPYNLSEHNFPIQRTDISLARTFEVQVKKLKNKMVMIDIGEKNHHIGKIVNVEDQFVEMQPARTNPIYLNIHHIKTLHQL